MALANSILLGVNAISTVVATSEAGDFVGSNLINTQPSEIWRATSAAQQTLTGALTRTSRISGFALSNHNLFTETVRLELATDAQYLNVTFDQTWTAREPDYGWGEGTWGNLYSTFGGYALDDGGITTQLIKTFSAVSALYYRITIGNITTTVPQAGVLYLGEAFQPGIGVARDPDIPVIDPSEITMTRGQAMRSNNLRTFREITVRYVALTSSEAHLFRRICRLTGSRALMVFSLQPGGDTLDEKETKMVCRMVDWSGPTRIAETTTPHWTASATFREAL